MDVNSQEYKDTFISTLVHKGMKREDAVEDYYASVETDDSLTGDPVADAEECLSYYLPPYA